MQAHLLCGGSMGVDYLSIAMTVLSEAERPLNAAEITEKARARGLLPDTTRTPDSSFRARLSVDLRHHGFQSAFQRVSAGRYALRSWGLPEFIAPPLTRPIPDEIVTCIRADAVPAPGETASFSKKDAVHFVEGLRDRARIKFIARPEAEGRCDFRQIISYVILRHGDDVLTYRRGHMSSADRMLRGALCLGFGGHVQQQDSVDLFGLRDGGVVLAAQREIREELDGLTGLSLSIIGLINDLTSPEGTRHVGVALEATLPRDFTEARSRRERAVNDLRLMPMEMVIERYHEMEYWSQLITKHHMFCEPGLVERCVTRPPRVARGTTVVAVVGEIASGKTTLCNAMAERLGFRRVSTRECVARLVGAEDFGTGRRTKFQTQAQALISRSGGPQLLAQEIAREIDSGPTPVVIDGIRHLKTYRLLKEYCTAPIGLLYIDTSRDLAVRNFIQRAGYRATVDDFRNARSHEVEAGIPLLKREADAYIFNGGSKDMLVEGVRKWLQI